MDKICLEYERRIGTEVLWVSELTKNGSDVLGHLNKNNPSMNYLNEIAIQTISKMQITYVVNIFESFVQGFICQKDNLDKYQTSENKFWDTHLKETQSEWDNYCNNSEEELSSSKSFMNVRYSLFVLEKKYGLQTNNLPKTLLELGSVRNCIVHHNSDLSKLDKGGKSMFRKTIYHTLKLLGIRETENQLIFLDKNN